MKFLDRYLRDWRIRVTKPYIRPNNRVLDIGCFDGHLFKSLKSKSLKHSIGLDSLLKDKIEGDYYTLIPEDFPQGIGVHKDFDCITMLAVLEHIPPEQQLKLSSQFYNILNPSGRIIITVPSAFVDYILIVLTKLKLIDGMSLEEHYGFDIKEVFTLFEKEKFQLIKHKKFQLGLNNLFVFEKIG